MKKLVIETVNPAPYAELSKMFEHFDAKYWIENNTVYCEIDEMNNEEYISTLLNIGVLLLINYVPYSKLCKTEAQHHYVMSHFMGDEDYRYAMLIDLLSYFENNSLLKEASYFLFNMSAVKTDIVNLLDLLKKQEAYDKETKMARENIKRLGKKLSDYKELYMVMTENHGFCIQNKKGVILTPESVEKEFGLSFRIDNSQSEEMYIAAFTGLLCSVLNTKVLNVSAAFLPICDYLIEALQSLSCDIEVNIYEE